jgi:hypothetical protein
MRREADALAAQSANLRQISDACHIRGTDNFMRSFV